LSGSRIGRPLCRHDLNRIASAAGRDFNTSVEKLVEKDTRIYRNLPNRNGFNLFALMCSSKMEVGDTAQRKAWVPLGVAEVDQNHPLTFAANPTWGLQAKNAK